MARFLTRHGISRGRIALVIAILFSWRGQTLTMRAMAPPELEGWAAWFELERFFSQTGWFSASLLILLASAFFLFRSREILSSIYLVAFFSIFSHLASLATLSDRAMIMPMLPITAAAFWGLGLLVFAHHGPVMRDRLSNHFACGAVAGAILLDGIAKLTHPLGSWTSGHDHAYMIFQGSFDNYTEWMNGMRHSISEQPDLCGVVAGSIVAIHLLGVLFLVPRFRKPLAIVLLIGMAWTTLFVGEQVLPAALAIAAMAWSSLESPDPTVHEAGDVT